MKSFYEDDQTLRDLLKKGVSPDKPLRKQFICDEVKMIDEEKLLVNFIISTSSIDRYGDTVSADGWDLKNYKKNPVVLFAHDSMSPPIGRCVPKSLTVDKNKLHATAEFMSKDVYDFSYMIFQMYAKGFMKATSVGFRPLEWSFVEDDDRPFGVDFKRQELLEFSCVPVPANPEALVEAKSLGVELAPLRAWAEQTLDTWEKHKDLLLPRDVVEKVYKNSKTIDRKKTMPTNLVKFELDGDKIKSVSAVTGEFVPEVGKHALVLTKGKDSTITEQEIDLDAAKEVLKNAIKADSAITGYVLEVGVEKTSNEKVYKSMETIKGEVTNVEPPYTTTCPGCSQLVQVEANNSVCPLCGCEGLTRPAKAVEPEVKKDVVALEVKVTLESTLKSFVEFVEDKDTVTKNLNDLIEVYLTLGDTLLETKETTPDLFKSRKSMRLLNQMVEQSKSVSEALDLNDKNVIKEEEKEEFFELVEDKITDEYYTLEEATELLKGLLPELEKNLEEKTETATNKLLDKLRGRVE